MNYGLVISALEKHVRMAQAALDFARIHRKGEMFSDALIVLEEATRALDHVRKERKGDA